MIEEKDKEQFKALGIKEEEIARQLENFCEGFPYLDIVSAATVGDGIMRLDESDAERYVSKYDEKRKRLSVVKFVPASGAATRMFKDLYAYLDSGKITPSVQTVFDNIQKFAFYDALKALGTDFDDMKSVIKGIVEGLEYGNLPKGLILFHMYEDHNRKALEEHMAEGAMYAVSQGGTVSIHFTVSPEHVDGFQSLLKDVQPMYEEIYGVKYDIGFSTQKRSTDTIAVDMNNRPFRNASGEILFRPAGHGALLANLDAIDADIIFIKTLDNVVPDRIKEDTVKYKKVLAGVLLEKQQWCFEYLHALKSGANENLIEEVKEFIADEFSIKLPSDYRYLSHKEKAGKLQQILDRPIRVCGMVRNEGEPGGGPFKVRSADGTESLQIAESSQISPKQAALMKEATHFNPVDLVCGVRNLYNEKYDLADYIDPKTGFISVKSKDGRELKAQELPGLWNGSMAGWNTVFVEVPVSTFSPVKVVNDLLRPEHQN